MMMRNSFAIIGGDERQLYLANSIKNEGANVSIYGFDRFPVPLYNIGLCSTLESALLESNYIILPVPSFNKDKIHTPLSANSIFVDEMLSYNIQEKIIFGSKITSDFREKANLLGAHIYDYLSRDELAILNAIPTAEGAIEVAMRETSSTIFGTNCLIAGYGRIGKILSANLKALGANVSVSARRQSDFAYITANRMTPVNTSKLCKHLPEFDIIFNTIPHLIFKEAELKAMKKDVLIIDLASAPGGVDFEMANKLSIKNRLSLSLPGKVAPKSAGEIVWNTIKNIIEEENL